MTEEPKWKVERKKNFSSFLQFCREIRDKNSIQLLYNTFIKLTQIMVKQNMTGELTKCAFYRLVASRELIIAKLTGNTRNILKYK